MAVAERQAEIRGEIARNPTQFFAREVEHRLDDARTRLGAFLGSDPAALAWIDNTTTGINTVLQHVERRIGRGDEVVVTDHEYNACRNALEAMTQRVGATIRTAAVPFPISDPRQATEAVLSRVGDRTRLVVLDHVTSQSALALPVEGLVGEIETAGIPTLIDGAHAPGMLPLDLDSLGASFYVGNCHKWLCAPHGAAFLRVAPAHRDAVDPLVISHGWNDVRPERSRFRKLFDWVGTDDPSAMLSVPAAIDTIASSRPGGWPAVMSRNRALAIEARRLVLDRVGARLPRLTRCSVRWRWSSFRRQPWRLRASSTRSPRPSASHIGSKCQSSPSPTVPDESCGFRRTSTTPSMTTKRWQTPSPSISDSVGEQVEEVFPVRLQLGRADTRDFEE